MYALHGEFTDSCINNITDKAKKISVILYGKFAENDDYNNRVANSWGAQTPQDPQELTPGYSWHSGGLAQLQSVKYRV